MCPLPGAALLGPPWRSFFCVATCTVMCVHIAYILTHPKRTRSRYHASVLLLKVLCPWAPGNFCTLSTWPAHWPVLFMYVSACDPHPVLRFQVTKEYSLCHLLSFLSSDSVFLPVSSSLWSHSSPFPSPPRSDARVCAAFVFAPQSL